MPSKSVEIKSSIASGDAKNESATTSTQSSRKGKKAWRKNVDLASIEDALDQGRTEERMSGSKLVDRSNESLFFTDKSGDENVRKSMKHRKLKIEEILTPKSAFQGIRSRSTPSSTILSLDGIKPRQVSKSVTHQINQLAEKKKVVGAGPGTYDRLKSRIKEAKKAQKQKSKGGYNLWSERSIESTDENQYLEPVKVKPVKKPVLPTAPLADAPRVEIAHAGTSYRPDFGDHQALLGLALEEEMVKINAKEKVEQKLAYPPELDDIDDEDFFANEDDVQEQPDISSLPIDTEPMSKPTDLESKNKRKTRAERNKEFKRLQAQKEEERIREQKKINKQINMQVLKRLKVLIIFRIQEIKKTIDQEVTAQAEAKAHKLEEKSVEKMTLGPRKFRPTSMDLQLTEELTDSLRTLKPEGNLFKDRFQSLQKRQLIETRVPVSKKRRYKLKETESHDYKRFK